MHLICKKYFTKIFLIFFFIFGVSLIKNYGISFDEESNRLYGLVNGNYILKTFLSEKKHDKIFNKITSEKFSEKIKIKKPTPLHEFPDRAYGVIFELPVTAMEILLDFSTFHDSFFFRHFMTFFLYTISLIFFYLLLNKIFKNKILSFLGIVFLITYPRIFAHSFYNSKDIVFMSLFIITTYFGYSYLLKKKLKNFLLFCFFSACSINLRSIAFVLPLMVYSNILLESYRSKNFKNKSIYLMPIVIIFFYISFGPFFGKIQ